MDDLESFFYVLCWLCSGFYTPGRKLELFPPHLLQWADPDPTRALDAKTVVYTFRFARAVVPAPYFSGGGVFRNLLRRLRDFFEAANAALSCRPKGGAHLSRFELKAASAVAYEAVLGYVDEAIQTVPREDDTSSHSASSAARHCETDLLTALKIHDKWNWFLFDNLFGIDFKEMFVIYVIFMRRNI